MVSITWVGHGTWYLEADGHSILVDPFVDSSPSAPQKNTDFSPETILVTHAHGDHVADVADIAKRSGSTVYAIAELAGWIQKQGVGETVGFNMGGTVQIPGGSVKMTPAWHTSVTPDGSVSTPPAGYVVRFGDRTIYFAGDTALFGDMRLIGEEGLDIAVLPIGDHFTMGPADAVKAAGLLGAPIVLPGHYNTFPAIQQDIDAFARDVKSKTSGRVEVFPARRDPRTLMADDSTGDLIPGAPTPPVKGSRAAMNAEITRTAFQRKAVSRLSVTEIHDLASAFFRERGYRVGRTGRPGQLFVMGPAEGALPRVTGEVNVQANVGRGQTQLIRLDAAGEKLGPTMADFHAHLRTQRRAASDTR